MLSTQIEGLSNTSDLKIFSLSFAGERSKWWMSGSTWFNLWSSHCFLGGLLKWFKNSSQTYVIRVHWREVSTTPLALPRLWWLVAMLQSHFHIKRQIVAASVTYFKFFHGSSGGVLELLQYQRALTEWPKWWQVFWQPLTCSQCFCAHRKVLNDYI